MNRSSFLLRGPAFTCVAALLTSATLASAQTVIDWSSTASTTSWTTDANWVGGSAPANDITTNIARFNQTSYVSQPYNSTTAGRSIAGVIIGDGSTATATLTMAGQGTGDLTIGANGVSMLANAGTATIGSFSAGGLVLAANQTWTNNSSNTLDAMRVMSGGFSLEKSGSGVLILSRANTFSGGFTLTQGTVRVADPTSFGTGTVNLNAGVVSTSGASSRTIGNTISVGGNVQLGDTGFSGIVTYSGTVTVNGDRTITLANNGAALTGAVVLNGNLTLSSTIAFSGSGNTITAAITDGAGTYGITKTGTGLIKLNGVNTFDGDVSIQQGTLSINTASIGDAATVFLVTGAKLDLAFAGLDTIGGLSFDGVAQGEGTYGAIGSGADFQSSFFTGTGMLNVVPEPTSLALLGCGMLTVLVFRRRSRV
ncbi:MAG: autotransporter-associated beta strand repeat-containing protein [Chthoniobacterales bacterium]|nr:autotransporter-associated beta strand repeat-containing protein [Chthoniobacterales bacterium]